MSEFGTDFITSFFLDKICQVYLYQVKTEGLGNNKYVRYLNAVNVFSLKYNINIGKIKPNQNNQIEGDHKLSYYNVAPA